MKMGFTIAVVFVLWITWDFLGKKSKLWKLRSSNKTFLFLFIIVTVFGMKVMVKQRFYKIRLLSAMTVEKYSKIR